MEFHPLDTSKHPYPGHVTVGASTEDALLIGKTGGKKRAPKGLPHLAGGKFGRPLWDGYWKTAPVGQQADRYKKDVALSWALDRWGKEVTNTNPSLNPELQTVATLPTKPDYTFGFFPDTIDPTKPGKPRRHSISARSDSSTSSGSTQASSNDSPHQKRSHSADPSAAHMALSGPMQNPNNKTPPPGHDELRHGWYHRKNRNDPDYMKRERAMWCGILKKSKDHIGYGNGMIGYGDVQSTSLDKESPTWMFGMRMVDGVVGSGFPRWQYCMVEDGKLNTQPRYFQRGPNLSTIETIGGNPPPQPTARTPRVDINYVDDKRKSSMVGTGAICKKPFFPVSEHRVKDPDHRIFYKVDRY